MPMQRDFHVAVWLRMLAEGEIRLKRSSYKLFKAQGTRAANAFNESPSIPAVVESIANSLGDWVKVLMAHYLVTIKNISDYTKEQLTGQKSHKQNFQTRIQNFIATQGLSQAKLITESTIDRARKIINAGQENGDSEVTIGKALEDGIGGEVAASRAGTIARTEVHNAATYAMQETAEEIGLQTGLIITREWVAVEDERTRSTHSDADGQIVGINEPFQVGDGALDRPGDPNGPAEEVINCRCTLIYYTSDNSENIIGDDEGDAVGPGGFIGE